MRLAHARIKQGCLADFKRLYEDRVIPALQTVDGCVYACLVQSTHRPDEYISMTLWEMQKHADEYVNSRVFQHVMNEAQPLFADSTEWKVQLTTDLKLEYQPVAEEPIVDSLQVEAVSAEETTVVLPSPVMYLRIVSMKVLPDKRQEFERLYKTEELFPPFERQQVAGMHT